MTEHTHVTRHDVEFVSEGNRIAGWLYRTADAAPQRAVAMSSGYAGVRGALDGYGYPQRFAAAGITTLLFDNPHLGDSEGEPRQELDPIKQQRAYRDALTFLAGHPGVDPERLGIWGTSYSGGHVLVVGATDRRVKAVVSQAMTISGHANMLRRYSPSDYAALAARFAADRLRRANGEPPEMVQAFSESSDSYQKTMSRPESWRRGWRNEITLRSLELYDEYEPARTIDRISPRPLLMIVPLGDQLTPSEDALAAYERALQPKQLITLSGDHYAVYEEHFEVTAGAAVDWFTRHL